MTVLGRVSRELFLVLTAGTLRVTASAPGGDGLHAIATFSTAVFFANAVVRSQNNDAIGLSLNAQHMQHALRSAQKPRRVVCRLVRGAGENLFRFWIAREQAQVVLQVGQGIRPAYNVCLASLLSLALSVLRVLGCLRGRRIFQCAS
jgi:hypothetical protein